MAFHEDLTSVSIEAGGDLSADQYKFVAVAADGQVDVAGNGVAVTGVLQNKPAAAGRAAEVGISGISKVLAGGTVAAGDDVASDASGQAVVATTGENVAGIAITGGASGEIISIKLDRGRAAA